MGLYTGHPAPFPPLLPPPAAPVFCVAGSVERNQIEMRQVVPSQNDFLIDRRKSFEWLVVPALVPVLWHVEQSNLALEWGMGRRAIG
jgi:hypothetical protein